VKFLNTLREIQGELAMPGLGQYQKQRHRDSDPKSNVTGVGQLVKEFHGAN
jgi:hypothetical protein